MFERTVPRFPYRMCLLVMRVLVALVCGQPVPSPAQGKTATAVGLCSVESFPSDIKRRLEEEFVSWTVQEPANLGAIARERWGALKPLECPGIAIGRFSTGTALSYTVLLVPTVRRGTAYKLIVFSPKTGQAGYGLTVLDQSNDGKAENYMIHTISIADFFNQQSRTKFKAYTRDGILFVDAGEREYGSEVYFWTDGQYRHEPVDY